MMMRIIESQLLRGKRTAGLCLEFHIVIPADSPPDSRPDGRLAGEFPSAMGMPFENQLSHESDAGKSLDLQG
jgi:hypothetical protein